MSDESRALPKLALLNCIERAESTSKVVDVTNYKIHCNNSIPEEKIIDLPPEKSSKKGVPGINVVSENYNTFKSVMKVLGENYEQFTKLYYENYVKIPQNVTLLEPIVETSYFNLLPWEIIKHIIIIGNIDLMYVSKLYNTYCNKNNQEIFRELLFTQYDLIYNISTESPYLMYKNLNNVKWSQKGTIFDREKATILLVELPDFLRYDDQNEISIVTDMLEQQCHNFRAYLRRGDIIENIKEYNNRSIFMYDDKSIILQNFTVSLHGSVPSQFVVFDEFAPHYWFSNTTSMLNINESYVAWESDSGKKWSSSNFYWRKNGYIVLLYKPFILNELLKIPNLLTFTDKNKVNITCTFHKKDYLIIFPFSMIEEFINTNYIIQDIYGIIKEKGCIIIWTKPINPYDTSSDDDYSDENNSIDLYFNSFDDSYSNDFYSDDEVI